MTIIKYQLPNRIGQNQWTNLYTIYPIAARAHGIPAVYKIPYSRAHLAYRPLGQYRARAKVYCIQYLPAVQPLGRMHA